MGVEVKEFKTLEIDVSKGVYRLNGETIDGLVSRLDLEFDNGKWSLLITKDEFYRQATTNGVME